LAERFPRADVPAVVKVLGTPSELAPGPVLDTFVTSGSPAATGPVHADAEGDQVLRQQCESTSAQEAAPPAHTTPSARVAPLSPGRFGIQLTVSQATHDKLRYAQSLLGHAVPSGELAEVLDRALDALIASLEKRKFAATDKPRAARRSSSLRHIPSRVKRAAWMRDQGRCTYMSPDGRRCEARKLLEYDHEQPLARGGQTTIANVRLRCRAHNQLEAEQVFGAGFMEEKRRAPRLDSQPGV